MGCRQGTCASGRPKSSSVKFRAGASKSGRFKTDDAFCPPPPLPIAPHVRPPPAAALDYPVNRRVATLELLPTSRLWFGLFTAEILSEMARFSATRAIGLT